MDGDDIAEVAAASAMLVKAATGISVSGGVFLLIGVTTAVGRLFPGPVDNNEMVELTVGKAGLPAAIQWPCNIFDNMMALFNKVCCSATVIIATWFDDVTAPVAVQKPGKAALLICLMTSLIGCRLVAVAVNNLAIQSSDTDVIG